jgi:glycosyltransferase involved in cell wall biosynthesis
MKPRGIAARFFRHLARLIDTHADVVVVLGPYMGDRVRERGARDSRIVQIPVWSRRDEVDPWPWQANPLRESLGLSDKTVFMYSGNMGLAHAFDELLQALEKLQHRADLVFLFVGDGPRRREIEARLAESPLPNVRMLDSMPRSDLGALLTLADVHLITMRPGMTGIVVPSKLYGIMAAARPALFVGPEHCETADTIREADCGITIRPGDVASLVAAIEELAASRGPREAMGLRGRELFLREYEREVCCNLWHELIESLVFIPRAAARPAPHAGVARAAQVGPPRLRRWKNSKPLGVES